MAAFFFEVLVARWVAMATGGLLVSALLGTACSPPATMSTTDSDMSGGGGDGGMPGPLTIAPMTASVGFGQTLQFSANKPVVWSVVEADGGSITSDGGVYTAPSAPTTAHVHAVTVDAPTEEATATVSVADHGLIFVAGHFGGAGSAEGVGSAARFIGPLRERHAPNSAVRSDCGTSGRGKSEFDCAR